MKRGGCECGLVAYEIQGEAPILSYACHCLHCQTRSGAAFSQQAFLPEMNLAVEGLTISSFRESNGAKVEEVFCAACFTRLFNRNTGLPGAVLLYAGTLTESDRLSPVLHMWTARKQPWIAIDTGIPTFSGTPTPDDFGRVLEDARVR